MRNSLLTAFGLLALASCASPVAPRATTIGSAPIEVNILAINDFHGNLEPPSSGAKVFNPAAPREWGTTPAGGAPRLATAVAKLAARNPANTIMVAAGDLIGASPLLSSLFHDEPTIESMSQMGLALTSVGNHEFDEGWKELRRMQDGGCHPVDGCKGPAPFKGAEFQYLAASTYLDNGETLFPPYAIREFGGVKVGFIGLTLEGTPDVITPAARAGITFKDEAETVNALVPKLRSQGIEAIVVLVHEGGYTTGALDDCHGLSGTIADIVPKFDKAVDVVVTGHTNGIYICTVDGRLVTSAGAYGTRVTDISILLDPTSGDVIGSKARDIIIAESDFTEDPAQVALIGAYKKQAEPLMNRVVGQISTAVTRASNNHGESALGDIIADSMLDAGRRETGKADIGFMNPGGIRTDLPFRDGKVTYSDIFAVQPFGNDLVVLTLTGADILTLLKQQYQAAGNNILQVSDGFTFAWRQPAGKPIEVVAGSVKLNGQPIVAEQTYRVVTNNFMAGGGDGFTAFEKGTDSVTIGTDIAALEAWLKTHSPLDGAIRGRITRAQ
ncbi:MAG TPA: bifunctional metallophosphatase/5'-nucleotidase [Hyphomonadaceae bacterium]|nr:bifunctional metallophosphatase/5'-nucleotidase [Hyphomonadaceae bacterium]HPI49666.1 bifunctional metallophosphatase/5'-nucleotidase [Hyphomonadaceae bacterium]